MGKRKRQLTAAERAEKERRKAKFQTVFVGGKQKRVRRAPTIDGMSVDEFHPPQPRPDLSARDGDVVADGGAVGI